MIFRSTLRNLLESWRPGYKYHLHGHAHGASQQRRNRMDVGVDATGVLSPISLDEVLARLGKINEGFPSAQN